MFVFTDASAKDDTPGNIERLKVEAAQYDSTISFFTNKVGCGDAKGKTSIVQKKFWHSMYLCIF